MVFNPISFEFIEIILPNLGPLKNAPGLGQGFSNYFAGGSSLSDFSEGEG